LAVEEWRHEQKAGKAHEHRSIACIARFEKLDADQHEQESDARIPAKEIAE